MFLISCCISAWTEKLAEEELDVDLSDPELAVAATKIQASFRGHMTRKNKEEPKN